MGQEEEQVSLMVLPDYSSGSGEKDINVLNFNLRYPSPPLPFFCCSCVCPCLDLAVGCM